MNRFRGKFGGDSISWPLWLRISVTLPIAFVGYVLFKSLFYAATDNAAGGALLLPLCFVFLIYSVPFLRALWRTNIAWRNEQIRREAESRHSRLMIERRLACTHPDESVRGPSILQTSSGIDVPDGSGHPRDFTKGV